MLAKTRQKDRESRHDCTHPNQIQRWQGSISDPFNFFPSKLPGQITRHVPELAALLGPERVAELRASIGDEEKETEAPCQSRCWKAQW